MARGWVIASEAFGFAFANTVMEGITVLPDTGAFLDQWVHGDLDEDQLMTEVSRRFGAGA